MNIRRKETVEFEEPYWRRTGKQDYQNVGSPAEIVEEAGITTKDSENAAKYKIRAMLLRDTTIDTWAGSGITGDWTDAEKQVLLLAWADGWSEAAAEEIVRFVNEPKDES